MSQILVNLVQLGFLGFAVAIMYLAYNLLQELVKNQGQNPQSLKLKMISVVFFLALSGGVLVLGIWFSFNDPNREVTINLDLYPEEDEMLSIIKFKSGNNSIPFDKIEPLSVRNEARLTVDVLALRDKFNALADELERLETRAAGFEAQSGTLLRSALDAPGPDALGSDDEQGI